jgi:hypothetical protein
MIAKTIVFNIVHTLMIVSMFVISKFTVMNDKTVVLYCTGITFLTYCCSHLLFFHNLYVHIDGIDCLTPGGTWKQIGLDIDGEAAHDEAGWSVAMSADGNSIVVGAIYHNLNTGLARVHSFSSAFNVWGQIGSDINGEHINDYSGTSVVMSADGKTIAVGASYNNGTGTQAGHVRAYTFKGNATSTYWEQLGSDIDGEAAFDQSGWAITMSADGKTIAIGAPLNDGNGADSGHVRVYSYSSTSKKWVQIGADINGEAPTDLSGYAVAMSADGKTIAVGAYLNDRRGTDSGTVCVYIFNNITTTWEPLGSDIDGEAAFDHSGFSVAISADGKTIAIGAPGNDGRGFDCGNVRVFAYNSTSQNWEQIGSDIYGEAAGDNFGWSVAMTADGKTIAVGAPYNDENGSNSGHVRVFSFRSTSNKWEQVGSDINGEAANDVSGDAVAISDDGLTIAVGATGNDGNGDLSGHVRVYKYDTPPTRTPTKSPTKSPTKVPTKSPTKVPTKSPTKTPSIVVQPTNVPTTTQCDTTCGILGLNIFCPFTFCGTFGRLLNMCDC